MDVVVGPTEVLTVAGASVILTILLQALFAALKLAGEQRDRFGPIIALVAGVVLVGGFAVVQGADLAAAFLTGILAGATSMGVHDTASALGAPV